MAEGRQGTAMTFLRFVGYAFVWCVLLTWIVLAVGGTLIALAILIKPSALEREPLTREEGLKMVLNLGMLWLMTLSFCQHLLPRLLGSAWGKPWAWSVPRFWGKLTATSWPVWVLFGVSQVLVMLAAWAIAFGSIGAGIPAAVLSAVTLNLALKRRRESQAAVKQEG